jgi:K+-sensing histidine kinase KdpD
LWEVLENAQKFHPQHTPKVDISISSFDAQTIRLCVQDNGMTLSPRQLERIWVPYIQGEKSFTGEVPGMGLGLPLVSTLVWQAGGSVRLTNRVDQPGVIVELLLPIVTWENK